MTVTAALAVTMNKSVTIALIITVITTVCNLEWRPHGKRELLLLWHLTHVTHILSYTHILFWLPVATAICISAPVPTLQG